MLPTSARRAAVAVAVAAVVLVTGSVASGSAAAPSTPGSTDAVVAPTSADRSDRPALAQRGYTRTQRKSRADALMRASMTTFQRVKDRAKSGIDTTFNWGDDGCSAPWWTGTAAYSALFNAACERHDFGYRNFGWGYYTDKNLALSSTPGTKDAVDSRFLADMRSRCAATGGSAGCYTVAQGFYAAIRKAGKAQTSFYRGECQPGYLCLFDDTDYEDRRVRLSASEDDMKDIGFGDKTSSVKNTSSVAWQLFDDHDYEDRSLCVLRLGKSADLDDYDFGDKTSSAKRRSGSRC